MRANEGRDVLLIDADEQGTASGFTSIRNGSRTQGAGYTGIRLLGEEIIHSHRSLKDKYQDIIIDAGGRDTASHRAGLGVADVALIPFQPSSFDVWELSKASKLITEIRMINPNITAYTFINMADPRGMDNQAAAEVAEEIEALHFLPHNIVTRKAFRRAAALGQAVTEIKPQDSKATEEMIAIYQTAFGEVNSKNETSERLTAVGESA
jgi:chromosome partitioning protein